MEIELILKTSMADLAKAIQFVQANGTAVDLARLTFLHHHQPAPPAVVAELSANQRDDGGFAPFWAADYSSLDATCYRLAQAEQVGIPADTPFVQQALAHLAARQQADGRFSEDPAITDSAPPWAKPGDLAATLYLTANCGFWLALWGDEPEPALDAADFLKRHLESDGRFPSFLHTHWLAAGLWLQMGNTAVYESVCHALHQQLDQLSAGNLAWMATTLLAAAAEADHPLIHAAAEHLDKLQQPDGRWPGDDGDWQDVHTTLEALRVLTARHRA